MMLSHKNAFSASRRRLPSRGNFIYLEEMEEASLDFLEKWHFKRALRRLVF